MAMNQFFMVSSLFNSGSVLFCKNWPLFTQLAASASKIFFRVFNGILIFASAVWRQLRKIVFAQKICSNILSFFCLQF
jgi:hypothetical protein